MKNCQYCDKEVQEDVKFCNHCGKSLADEQTVQQTESKEIDAQVKVSEPAVKENSQQEKKVVPAKKKKPQSKGFKIGLIAAVAIIILLIGTYYVGKSNTSVATLLISLINI